LGEVCLLVDHPLEPENHWRWAVRAPKMRNGCFRCSELQRRLNIILSRLSEGSGRTHLGQRCLCLFSFFLTRFPFFLFLYALYVTSSHVFRRSWWYIFESFPFGGDFSFEGVHGCAVCGDDRLAKQSRPKFVCTVLFRVVLQHHHNVRHRRRPEVRLRQKVTTSVKCLIHVSV